MSHTDFQIFDAHFHIVDPRFPLVPNRGYLPDRYTCNDYRERMKDTALCGGAVVSGSFQAFDQDYLIDALARLGPGFVGVTQLPATASDEEVLELDRYGVRAVRFNLERGGSEDVKHLDRMARRLHDMVGWHVELYVNSRELGELMPTLLSLPAVSVDHLGLLKEGFENMRQLAAGGGHIKATGFGRVDFDVSGALKALNRDNPQALMFGTDLPSTRAARPYRDSDIQRIFDALGDEAAGRVLRDNALRFYRIDRG